jgi:hypothetical protein
LRDRVVRMDIVNAFNHGGSTFRQIGQAHGFMLLNKNGSHCNLFSHVVQPNRHL